MSVPPYDELARGWKALRAFDVGLREIACVGAPRTLLVADLPALWPGPSAAVTVAIAAGVHGDEPASPWALLSLVRDGMLDRTFAYRLWACTNPTGYAAGTRANAEGHDINRSFGRGGTTPEARALITANRDRRFALSLDLHEDIEAAGFYCYEPQKEVDRRFGVAVVRAVEEAGFPIQELEHDFDLGYPLELARTVHRLEHGRVVPDARAEAAAFGSALPYNLYLLRRAAERTLTFETPRRAAWDARLAMHRVAVVTALERLRAELRAS